MLGDTTGDEDGPKLRPIDGFDEGSKVGVREGLKDGCDDRLE